MSRVQSLLVGLAPGFAALRAAVRWASLLRVAVVFHDRTAIERAKTDSVGGPFTLTDQSGKTLSSRDVRGHWVLLFFGYSDCPDVCPATSQEISCALAKLGPDSRRIVSIFVTLDPAREPPAVLKRYMAAFGPQFVGLAGSPARITSVPRAWRVHFARRPTAGCDYFIEHSNRVYRLDPGGKFVTLYSGKQSHDAMANDLRARP